MRLALLVSTATLLAGEAAADTNYVVQEGDTCIGIAIRVLGDRAALAKIHRLNPGLGKSPHQLVVGSTLVIPDPPATGPDARLTRTSGDVKIRVPSAHAWNAAQRGQDLFRAYRVGAASRASAELTFADDALLGMRERTIVVIYGPEKRLARVLTATAELENGTLESRLGELDGKPVLVRTKAGDATLRGNEVVVTTTDRGSTVSNHRGRAVELRGKTRTRTAVNVPAGMGTRVVPGKAPEPPRPLPLAPTWRSLAGPRLATANGTIAIAWEPSPRATQYRVAVRSDTGDVIAEHTVATTSIELALAPGSYQLTVAAFDADGLESAPTPPLAVTRVVPTIVAPGGTPADTALPARVVEGTMLIAPAGFTCSTGGAAVERLVLDRPGAVSIRCADAAGAALDPIAMEVTAIRRAPVVPAPVVSGPRSDRRRELGVYTGFHTLALRRTPIDLARDPDGTQALEAGSTVGLRGGWYRHGVGIESELGLSSLDRVAASGRGRVATLALHGALRGDDGARSFTVLAGLGLSTIVRDDVLETYRVVPALSWGVATSFSAGAWQLRLDLRHSLSAGYDDVAHALQATVGAAFDLDR